MSDGLRDRLVLAAVNVLVDGDPVLMIGVGDNDIRLGWVDDIVGNGMSDIRDLSDIDSKRLQITRSVDGSLRDRIAAALVQADQDWCSDNPLHEDMADAVIEALDRDYIIVKPGTPLAQKILEWQWGDSRTVRSAEKLGLTGDGE